jgi:nucleoid-associated protein YgaU
MFASNSRYISVADGVYTDVNGRQISYKLLRLTPDAPSLQTHLVVQEDRLDLLAFDVYRDPEQFWRIADANLALRPDDLLQVGTVLQIPLVQR